VSTLDINIFTGDNQKHYGELIMAKDYRNIDGLLKTIELMRPPDAVPGQITKTVGFAVYPVTLEQMSQLKAITGINNNSRLFRAIINFTDKHQSEFAEFLEESSQLKAE
jgi:hypothetical protein